MRGRKPKPTVIKKLEGNPGKRKLNRGEPVPSMDKPKCPTHLSDSAKKKWRQLSEILYSARLLTEIDGDALSRYCEAWATWVDAKKKVTASGMVVKTALGNPIQNPYLSIANHASEQMNKIAVEFGMTPSSRSRISLPQGDNEPSLEEQLFQMVGGAQVKHDGSA